MSYLLAIFSVLLLGDFREVIKTTSDGHVTVLTVYRRRGGIRAENQGSHSPFHRVTIQNAQQKTTYMLDLESNQYVEFIPRPTGFILTLATWIARSPAVVESHKTINIYFETIDTGERKVFFGQTARHLLVRERLLAEPGACRVSYETQKEGWYIKPRISTPIYRLAGTYGTIRVNNACHDNVIKHGDFSSPGFPVLETQHSITREIIDISEAPLDQSLFVVPRTFARWSHCRACRRCHKQDWLRNCKWNGALCSALSNLGFSNWISAPS